MKKIEIYLRKFLLNVLLLFRHSSKPVPVDYQNPNTNILFIRLNRIGDALVATPLIHEIRKAVKSKLFLLADKKNHFVFENNNDIDKVVVFEKGLKGIFKVLRFIKDNNINTVVDLHDDVSTTVTFLIALSNAPNKFGLEKANERIYTETVPRLNSENNHVIVRLLEICRLFNIRYNKDSVNVKYLINEDSERYAFNFLQINKITNSFLVGINISAGSKARFWGVSNYKRLLTLLSSFNVNYLILAAPDDLELANEISEDSTHIYSSKDYNEYAAMISKLNLLFTPDTAAVHLASAFRIPVFGIYVKYNTKDMLWAPYCSKFDYVVTEEPNLDNVSYESVIERFEPFLRTILFGNDKH